MEEKTVKQTAKESTPPPVVSTKTPPTGSPPTPPGSPADQAELARLLLQVLQNIATQVPARTLSTEANNAIANYRQIAAELATRPFKLPSTTPSQLTPAQRGRTDA